MSEDLIKELSGLASRTGSRAYVVGGYLRDRLLGREPADIDLLIEGPIAPFLMALSRLAGFEPVVFGRREPVTYRVAMGDWLIDLSACRAGGLNDALERRDFTINALAAPLDGEGPGDLSSPLDPLGGLADLRAGRIRHISPSGLEEDPVRLLRAVRLAVVLDGFTLAPSLKEAIAARAALLSGAPAERVLAEIELILASTRAGFGLRTLAEVGLLFQVLPELAPLSRLAQNRWHRFDALEHTLRVVEEADLLQQGHPSIGIADPLGLEDAEVLKWAAVYHDAGKPLTAATGPDGEVHFYGHETVSAGLARSGLTRLRVGARRVQRVVRLVANHLRLPLLSADQDVSDRALRRLVHQIEHDTPLLCLLAVADRRAGGGPDFERALERLDALAGRVVAVLRTDGQEVISPPPLLSGHEVMQILDLGPGPKVGSVLKWLTRLQVEDKIRHHDEAVDLLRSLPAARIFALADEA